MAVGENAHGLTKKCRRTIETHVDPDVENTLTLVMKFRGVLDVGMAVYIF